jgi:hypothetical protein
LSELWPWLTLALLGAYHGVNPAMGWLFAVALGLQERSRAAVIRGFAPIALGHAASIAIVVALVGAAQAVVAPEVLRVIGGSALILFGLYKLLAPLSHPRWVGMRVNFRDLTVWSFLMATAHGAGLLLVPILLQLPPGDMAQAAHAAHAAHEAHVALANPTTVMEMAASLPTKLAAVMVHTGAMFLVMAVIAVIVYEKVGLAILRRSWFNLDRVWAIVLLTAGALTFLL